jgi:hypothetical protein
MNTFTPVAGDIGEEIKTVEIPAEIPLTVPTEEPVPA